MQTLKASDFNFRVPEGADGEKRSALLELNDQVTGIDLEVRAVDLVVNLITTDGETFYLGSGDVVRWSGKVQGFAAIEIITQHTFAYQIRAKGRWREVPDPERLVVTGDASLESPIDQRIREELKRYLVKLQVDGLLADDAAVQELMDDIDNGDHEFEQEPDPFGLGYEERLAEWQAQGAVASAEGDLPLAGSDPAQQSKPAQEPANPGLTNAEKPGPTSSPT